MTERDRDLKGEKEGEKINYIYTKAGRERDGEEE